MKRITILLLTYFAMGALFSQSTPNIWYKADSANFSSNYWTDVSGNNHHAIFSEDILPERSIFNFNSCLQFSGNRFFQTNNLQINDSHTTTLIAYQTSDSVQEQGLWSFQTREQMQGLTTQRILSEDGEIIYGNKNQMKGIINSLSVPISNYPVDSVAIKIGFCDSLFFSGKIAEILVFDQLLEYPKLVKWLSYMAVKYGVTLQQTNYINGKDSVIWNYENNADYSIEIAGLGQDSIMGLKQIKTCFLQDKCVIGAMQNLFENHFLIFGSDESLLNQSKKYYSHGDSVLYYGDCLLQTTGENIKNIATFMRIHAENWKGDLSQYQLCIDKSGTGNYFDDDIVKYSPSFIDTIQRIIEFSNIRWDEDESGTDKFRFIYRIKDQSVIPNNLYADEEINDTNKNSKNDYFVENQYTIFPNPNNGQFTLKINLTKPSDVKINILNMKGQIIKFLQGFGEQTYWFNDHISYSGQYIIEINSSEEKKTLKMIVQ